MTSIAYRNQTFYELAMMLLYRQHYPSRYRTIADLIPKGATVLDVCCGPAVLFTRYLKKKDIEYTGLDINEVFVAMGVKKGIRMIHSDLAAVAHLPAADFVIMQASLYHFLPDSVSSVIGKMLAAAKEKVIIAEPVRNLSSLRLDWLARLAQCQSDAGSGPSVCRFDASSLVAAMGPFASAIEQSFPIEGGRETVYVLRVPRVS